MENQTGKQLKYVQIVEELKGKVLSGQIQPGDKLPSENVLAAQYHVSRQTVRKAIAILENEGYVYAEHGRGTFCTELVRHRHESGNIAVVTTYLSDYIFPEVIRGIDDVLTREGYSIILKNTRNSRTQEIRCLQELLQKDIDGIIIEPSKSQIYCRHTGLFEQLKQFQIPYVFIQGCYEQMKDSPQVLMDDCAGGFLLTKHLIEQGHRQIAGVFKADDMQGQNRHKGYARALAKAGIVYDLDKVVWFYTEDRALHPYEKLGQMVADGVLMDGVVCYNDQIAFEVIRALQHAGVQVPEDVSVCGYDNSPMAHSGELRLTTIAHPQERLGAMAAELLLRLIGGEEPGDDKILVEPELVIGNSTILRKNNL